MLNIVKLKYSLFSTYESMSYPSWRRVILSLCQYFIQHQLQLFGRFFTSGLEQLKSLEEQRIQVNRGHSLKLQNKTELKLTANNLE